MTEWESPGLRDGRISRRPTRRQRRRTSTQSRSRRPSSERQGRRRRRRGHRKGQRALDSPTWCVATRPCSTRRFIFIFSKTRRARFAGMRCDALGSHLLSTPPSPRWSVAVVDTANTSARPQKDVLCSPCTAPAAVFGSASLLVVRGCLCGGQRTCVFRNTSRAQYINHVPYYSTSTAQV